MLQALDADAVRRWYLRGLVALEAMRAEIDSLNVYPVADADTGTNLYFTLRSAVDATEETSPSERSELAMRMARQALLGARGSSGVILSQLLRGVGEVLAAERRPPRGDGLTRALERAVELGYAAVSHPVEGTMLTVAREAARAARTSASDDLAVVVAAAADGARRALARTPEQLDVLARAGVVDAGGVGVVVLLDVLRSIVDEAPLPRFEPHVAHPVLPPPGGEPVPAFEVMYLIDVPDDRVASLRRALDGLGNAVVVSGGDGLWNVHVHTDDAQAAVAAGREAGNPREVKVRPLGDQAARHSHRLVVIATTAGPQLVAATHALAGTGAQVVDVTEPGAVERLDAACGAAGECAVVIVAPATDADVPNLRVPTVRIPAAGVPALLAAIAVHDPHQPLERDAAAMAAAAAATRTAAMSPDDGDACTAALKWLDEQLATGGELVTIVSDAETAERIAAALPRRWPDVEANPVHVDGVPGYAFVGVE